MGEALRQSRSEGTQLQLALQLLSFSVAQLLSFSPDVLVDGMSMPWILHTKLMEYQKSYGMS